MYVLLEYLQTFYHDYIAWNEVTRGQESGVVHMEPCKPPGILL